MGQETTHVRAYDADVDRLHSLKERGDGYADVIRRLLDEYENQEVQTAN